MVFCPRVEVYDSMHMLHKAMVHKIMLWFLSNFFDFEGKKYKVWMHYADPRIIEKGTSPTQRDGHNCGAYLIENVKTILFHRALRPNRYHVDHTGNELTKRDLIAKHKKRWYNNLRPGGKWT
jgi:Ulp1 family protease